MQAIILGTPFLNGRTALSYYVLFMFVLFFVLLTIVENLRWIGYGITSFIMLFFVAHFLHSVNLQSVHEWRFDCNTYKVHAYLQSYMKEHPEVKTIDLNTHWLFNPSFGFYCITGKTPWLNLTEYHKETDTTSQTLFYYAVHDEASQLNNYTVALDFPDNAGVLLIKK